jgi:hypothetical protein
MTLGELGTRARRELFCSIIRLQLVDDGTELAWGASYWSAGPIRSVRREAVGRVRGVHSPWAAARVR